MTTRHCAGCKAELQPSSRNPRKWCSEACRVSTYRETSDEYRARKVAASRRAASKKASTAARRQQEADARRIQKWICQHCGKRASRQAVRGQRPKYCSHQCSKAAIALSTSKPCDRCGIERTRPDVMHCRPCQAELLTEAANYQWPSCPVPKRHPSRQAVHEPRLFVAAHCVHCGKAMILTPRQRQATTCSAECYRVAVLSPRRRLGHDRRRARKKLAFVENVSPAKIYARDGWRCHLCGKAIKRTKVVPHPLAPTVGHIIPLAQGGKHERANCAAAHFICNALKGDRGGGEQLALLG